MIAANIANETYNIKTATNRIKEMVEFKSSVEVLRDETFVNTDTSQIFPGDVIRVYAHSKIPADLLLLKGKCIVNEAMITGESTPLTK